MELFCAEDNPFHLEEEAVRVKQGSMDPAPAFKLIPVVSDQPKQMQLQPQFKGSPYVLSSDEVLRSAMLLFGPILNELREGTLTE